MPTEKNRPSPAAPLTDTGALYTTRDFRSQTQAVEKDTDSAWDLWVEANKSPEEKQKTDPRYARTAPQGLTTVPAGLGEDPGSETEALRRSQQLCTVEDAMVEARRNNRVCPRPNHWQALYDLLPDKKKNNPTPPLIGPAWNSTPSITKRTCLREHFEWAEEHGVLEEVVAFVRVLPETDWFHMND